MTCPVVGGLLAERQGYGRRARGGLDGVFVTVTSNADSGPGTLRELLKAGGPPRWIRFASAMTIDLKRGIVVPSGVTIDGRGRAVTLHDYGLEALPGTHDVILTHLIIDGRFRTEQVAFNIVGARDVWADHLDLSRFIDRLINVKTGATDVTLSWIKFHDHNKVMLLNNLIDPNLFAYWDRDSQSRVTLHHCWFVDTVQRNPRAVLGVYDIYDNLLENWDFYGMSFGLEARARIAGNIFVNTPSRSCVEPAVFQSIEHVDKNYCSVIAKASRLTALANGEADRAAYDETRAKYGYTHDYRAYLTVADNLYLEAARPALADFMPKRVPPAPYCTSYRRPSEAMAERIRREAGDTGAEGDAPTVCPTGIAPED
ncbi:MAG: pectate lyase family protein [Caulobacteraceae bacterium]